MKFKQTSVIALFVLFSATDMKAQDLTVGEVFNYKVGDEFHFVDTTTFISDFTSVFKEKVLNVDTVSDTVYYSIEVTTDDEVLNKKIAISLADLNKPVFDTSGLEILEIKRVEHLGKRSVEYLYGFFDDKNEMFMFVDRFTEGLGITYHLEQESGRRYAYGMSFYRSGNDSAGYPYKTKIELSAGETTILIDPNPFSVSTVVTLTNAPEGIEVFDLRMIDKNGLEVLHNAIYPEVPHRINAHSGLIPGEYFLVFESGDFKFIEKVVFKP